MSYRTIKHHWLTLRSVGLQIDEKAVVCILVAIPVIWTGLITAMLARDICFCRLAVTLGAAAAAGLLVAFVRELLIDHDA